MVVHLGKNYGFQLRRMADARGKMYLCAVIWWRKGDYLIYRYPSIRWL